MDTTEYYGGTYPEPLEPREEIDYETRLEMEMTYADMINEQRREESIE